jgi:hypothetical protein
VFVVLPAIFISLLKPELSLMLKIEGICFRGSKIVLVIATFGFVVGLLFCKANCQTCIYRVK